jgi:hypothetical protein
MALFFEKMPMYEDPFTALLPFATGASGSNAQRGTKRDVAHRAMPIDVQEVRICGLSPLLITTVAVPPYVLVV